MTSIEAFVDEVCLQIRERALRATATYRQSARETPEFQFESGHAHAYYAVVTLIQQTARTLGIDPKVVHLEDIDPNKDLI